MVGAFNTWTPGQYDTQGLALDGSALWMSFVIIPTAPDELAYIAGCTLVPSPDELAYIVCGTLAPSPDALAYIVVFEHALCQGWLVSRPSPAAPFSLGILKTC